MEGEQASGGLPEAHGVAVAGGSARLAYLIERYGEAIEADLFARYGVELGVLWRARKWRMLLNLIDRLPRTSCFGEAVAADEDVAVAVLANSAGLSEAPVAPAISEWSPEVAQLAIVNDRLGELIALTVRIHGGQLKIRPLDRPQTALARVRDAQRRIAHEALVARVLPGRAV